MNEEPIEPKGSRVIWKETTERMLLPVDCEREFQERQDKWQMAEWVNMLAPWEVIAHLTFRWEGSMHSARRCYERWMVRKLPQVSYFYAEEENPGRPGYHVHALWSDARNVYRKEAWADWFKRYGRAKIEPVRSYNDVSNYCSKYVCKERAWWNVKLQWHRVQALHKRDFKLRDESVCLS